ncbi:cytochrome c-type biogenesis protein CcmH [Rhodobacter sp. NTK016B]|uniref:cytochrome c-type biogenesis protein n=1 Tax=Rhodobacter sp. NTK016B TaxID=2759676 RepID=UPI001A8E86B2|nr:cytochrome c-type biogenesis protein [Rhodobacter sp. NTK016B]MBN8291525.1 cytochrome c-type biogenesis protein CcmH [Rhodobacter sp. NTK016B]
MRKLFLTLALMLLALPALAVQPDEVLADPALEARAREITAELRCVVCRNESVDDSNADIARDIRLMVRERLVAGDSNEEAIQFMVDRFGEFVLLNPRATGTNLILWITGPVLLVLGLGIAVLAIRRRKPGTETLNEAEEARLRQLLEE